MSVYSLIKCRNNVQILTRSLHTSLTRDTFMIDTYFYDMRNSESGCGTQIKHHEFSGKKHARARAMFHYVEIYLYCSKINC